MGSKRYSNKGYNAAKREEAVKDQRKSSLLFTVICTVVVALIAVGVIVLAIVFGGNKDGDVIDHGDHTHIEGVEDTIHGDETTAGVIDHGDHTHAAGEEINH
jgi:hypothetical protein